mmetsp:Transcript_29031/g.68226  ORF Transcript_29031/g.68226 Transcript_29031/m.68226 type:complete len:159 (-) Transcript_29031:224-700(-)
MHRLGLGFVLFCFMCATSRCGAANGPLSAAGSREHHAVFEFCSIFSCLISRECSVPVDCVVHGCGQACETRPDQTRRDETNPFHFIPFHLDKTHIPSMGNHSLVSKERCIRRKNPRGVILPIVIENAPPHPSPNKEEPPEWFSCLNLKIPIKIELVEL